MVDIAYSSSWGELHYVVLSGLSGIYSYFVATDIATVGKQRRRCHVRYDQAGG